MVIRGMRVGKLTVLQGALKLLTNGQELDAGPDVRAGALRHAEGPAAACDVASVFPNGLEAFLEEVDGFVALHLVNGRVVVVAPKVLYTLNPGPELVQLRLIDAGVLTGWRLLLPTIRTRIIVSKRKAGLNNTWNGVRRNQTKMDFWDDKALRKYSSSTRPNDLICRPSIEAIATERGEDIRIKPDIPVMLGRKWAHRLEEVVLRITALVGGGADVRRVRIGALRQPRQAPGEERRSRVHVDEL